MYLCILFIHFYKTLFIFLAPYLCFSFPGFFDWKKEKRLVPHSEEPRSSEVEAAADGKDSGFCVAMSLFSERCSFSSMLTDTA